jgi:3-oxoacyl-[acyl-carrier protein] reductase
MSVLTTDLRPHLALVTGASGGIGKATCLALASMGCSIAVHYHSSISAAEELVKQLKEKGVRVEAFKADLTKYDEVSHSGCSGSLRTTWGSPCFRMMD